MPISIYLFSLPKATIHLEDANASPLFPCTLHPRFNRRLSEPWSGAAVVRPRELPGRVPADAAAVPQHGRHSAGGRTCSGEREPGARAEGKGVSDGGGEEGGRWTSWEGRCRRCGSSAAAAETSGGRWARRSRTRTRVLMGSRCALMCGRSSLMRRGLLVTRSISSTSSKSSLSPARQLATSFHSYALPLNIITLFSSVPQ